VYRLRCFAGNASPVVRMPHMLAATAQPTRQSSQWLSGLVGKWVHCRTGPQGPATLSQFEESGT